MMAGADPVERLLRRGLAALGLELDSRQIQTLGAYLELLVRWNRAYNLTAVREPLEMVPRHLLDSLAILRYLEGTRMLDLGSGAGLPGIPLAVARPDSRWVLLDSNGKKVRFCRQVVLELGLANVEVLQVRAEAHRPEALYDTVVSRAVADLKALCGLALPLLASGGVLLAMKAADADAELAAVAGLREYAKVSALEVPGLDAKRNLVVVSAHCRRPGVEMRQSGGGIG